MPNRTYNAPRRHKIDLGRTKKAPLRKSHAKLKKELDAVFSRYIRLRDKGQCYTCPKKGEIKEMQNGHFIPRQYLSTRYDEVNCHCQCYACNMLYNGQPSAYAVHLVLDYGRDIIETLEAKRRDITKSFPFEEKMEYYQKAMDKLTLTN